MSRTVVLTALLVLVGCSSTSGSDSGASSPPPETERGITLSSDSLKAGDEFTATFEPSNSRGGFFYLYAWEDEDWGEPVYLLQSDANGSAPKAMKADDQGVEAYGIDGPGPDGLILPLDIPAGPWRVCTAEASEGACAQFTVN